MGCSDDQKHPFVPQSLHPHSTHLGVLGTRHAISLVTGQPFHSDSFAVILSHPLDYHTRFTHTSPPSSSAPRGAGWAWRNVARDVKPYQWLVWSYRLAGLPDLLIDCLVLTGSVFQDTIVVCLSCKNLDITILNHISVSHKQMWPIKRPDHALTFHTVGRSGV